MAGEKTASFAVNLESNAPAVSAESAAALAELVDKINKSAERAKALSVDMHALRGATDTVVSAKKDLKAQLESERGAMSQAVLQINKMGHSYGELAAAERKAEAAQKKLEAKRQADVIKRLADSQHKLTDGLKAARGPVADLSDKFGHLKELLGGTGGGMAALGLGVGLVVAGVVGLTATLIAATVKLGTFVVESADAMRTLGLMRESMTGSAASGKALGTWVDWMGHRVALSRDKLTDLALQLDKTFSPARSRVGPEKLGRVTQEAFYSASRAMAGMGKYGDEAAGKITGIIERGKVLGRLRLVPEDLEGTGLKFAEVAAGYAKIKGIPIDRARTELQGYSADVEDVARAFNAATDTRWAKTNAEGLLGLDAQWAKFKERLTSLAGQGVLEPLLKGLSRLAYAFDPASASGKRLQATFEKIGTAIGNIDIDKITADIGKGIDWVNDFVDSLGDISATFTTLQNDPTIGIIIDGLKVIGIVVGVVVGVVILTLLGIPLALGLAWRAIKGTFTEIKNALTGIDWAGLGKDIIDGLIHGISAAGSKLWDIIKGLGTGIKNAFKSALGIHSPSTVFAGYGIDTAAGYAKGIEEGTPRAQGAAASMAPPAPAPSSTLGPGGGGGTVVMLNVTYEIQAGASNGPEIVRAMKESSMLADLQKAVRQVLLSQGVPTQATVS